jgi:cation transport ATPase
MADDNEKIKELFDEHKRGRIWIQLAMVLGLTIVIAGALDLLFQGVPLGFTIPLLNESASISRIMYHSSVTVVGIYIGFIGLKELIFEKRFSMEFLMSAAALGAAYLDFLFEGATVLFLYSLSEYLKTTFKTEPERLLKGFHNSYQTKQESSLTVQKEA